MLRLLERECDETVRLIERELGWGCWIWDLRSNEMEWSRGYCDLLGVEPDTVTPSFEAIQQLTHPEDRPHQAEIERIIREASSISRQFRVIQPSGRVVWISCHIIVLAGRDGAPEKALGVCSDVTSFADQLSPLQITYERYKALIRATDAVVWIAKADGKLHELPNWGYLRTEPTVSRLDENWIQFLHPEDRAPALAAWKTAIVQNQVFEIECRFRQPDGSYVWKRTRGVPILGREGGVKEWLGVNADMEIRARSRGSGSTRLTGAQIRAARGLLRWSVMDLARRSKVSRAVIRRLEEI